MVDSVKKLISLNMSDEDIVRSLVDSGVSQKEAKSVVEQVRGSEQSDEGVVQEEGKELFDVEEENKPVAEPDIEDMEGPPQLVGGLNEREKRVLDLWEKGILATVDSKISEMQRLKGEIDSVIDKKIEKALLGEMKKITSVFESQRVLTLEKSNALLEEKSKEFDELVNSRISEMKKLNVLSEEYFRRLESQKKFIESVLQTVDEKISTVEELKKRLLEDFGSQIAKLRSDVESFLKDSDKKRVELNERINMSLHLETQIVEGLMHDAQNKIDNLALSKTSELEKTIEAKLEQKKSALEEVFLREKDKLQKSFSSTKSSVEKKLSELEKLEGEIDVDAIRTTMEDLDVFRKQFVANVEKSIDSLEKSKKDFAQLVEKRESLIEKKMELIDAKIKELTVFEQRFAEEMGIAIEKLSEKQPADQSKSPKKA